MMNFYFGAGLTRKSKSVTMEVQKNIENIYSSTFMRELHAASIVCATL